MELANREEEENGAEEEPFLARRRQVVPWRRHGPKIVVHPEDMRRRLRSLPHSLRAELKLRADQLEEADACDTLADAARRLAIPERDLQNRTTEDFIEACAKAGMPESTQRKLAKLHVDLVGRRCVWATNSSGPEDPVPHRGGFYLSYPQRQSRDRGSRYRIEEQGAADATTSSLPGQLVRQGAANNGGGQNGGWQQISLESGDRFFWHERRNQVTYGKPGDSDLQGGLVAGEAMMLQEALEIQDKRTMHEDAWKALPGDHPNDDCDQRKWNRKRKQQACRLRVSGFYPLHMALCKEAEPQLSKAILEFNQAACRVRAPDGRLPLHQALIHWKDFQDDQQRQAQTELVYDILRAFPEACQVKEPLHGRLPLHCALRVRAADDLVMEILDYYEEACRTEDSYGKKPLHYCATANTRLVKTENAVIVDNCRLLTFPPIDAKGRESTLRQYGLATNGFSLHESYAFNEHDKGDRDDNLDAVLQRCGIGEDERREHTLGQQLVSKEISLRVLALDPKAACKADEAGRTPAYLSLYNCTDDDVRTAIGQQATNTSIGNGASANLAQLARDKQEVTEARSKLRDKETELAAAEKTANETRLELDNAKIQNEKSKAEAKIAETTYNAVRKELQELVNEELTNTESMHTAVQEKLLERKAATEGLVTQKKRECRNCEKKIARLTQGYETAMSRKTKLEQELDQLQEDYEREKAEWKNADRGAQGKQQRLDTNYDWYEQESRGLDGRVQRTAAQTVNQGIAPDAITKAVEGVSEKEPKQALGVFDQDLKTRPAPRSLWQRFCCAQRH